jgi:HPt (histidine-containing phosphotransfer) domain-containing protein
MPLFDAERVDALFAALGEAQGRRLLDHFADALTVELQALTAIAAEGDLCETERHAHGLKGAAANFGATRLQAVSREVEQAARAANGAQALNALLAELGRVAVKTSVAARKL